MTDELVRFRRGAALVLAAVGVVAATAAVLGFPLVFVVGRGPSNVDHFAGVYRSEYSAWLGHDGWRASGAAWIYAAVALAAVAGAGLFAGVVMARGTRALALVTGPAALVVALGPLLQHLAGAGWSNYSSVGDDFMPFTPVWAVVVLVLWGVAIGSKWSRERRRGSTRIRNSSARRTAGRH